MIKLPLIIPFIIAITTNTVNMLEGYNGEGSGSAVIAIIVLIITGIVCRSSQAVLFAIPVLAAILAVIGYSLNDTIVVFDRIRDNFLKMRKLSPIDITNKSINQTLARTVMTSVATIIVVFVLFFIGGELIHGFATALIIGIIVGTYSSIYIASAIALALGVSKADLMPVQKEGVDDNTP